MPVQKVTTVRLTMPVAYLEITFQGSRTQEEGLVVRNIGLETPVLCRMDGRHEGMVLQSLGIYLLGVVVRVSNVHSKTGT